MMNFEMKGAGASFSLPGSGEDTGGIASNNNDIAGIIQQTTRCPICLMKYTNPKRLPCDHSFCRNCLQGELDRQKQNKGTLSCIVCQEPVNLPAKNGVDQLDGVLIIHDITQFYDTTPQPKVQCGKCNGAYCSSCVNLVCNRCDKYISTEFCTDCFDGFCSRCAEEHERTTGDHILVDVDQAHEMIKDASDDEDGNTPKKPTTSSTFDEQLEQNGAGPITVEIGDQEQPAEEDSDDSSELNYTYDVSGANGAGGDSSELPLNSSEDGGLDDIISSPAAEGDSDDESELDCVYEVSGSNQRLNGGEISADEGSNDEGDGGIQFIGHYRSRSSRSINDDGPLEEDDLESSDDEFDMPPHHTLQDSGMNAGATSNPLFAFSDNTIQSASNDDSSSQASSSSEVIVAYDTSQGLPDLMEGGDQLSSVQHPLRDHSIPGTINDSFNPHEETSSSSAAMGHQTDHTHILDPGDQQGRERRVLIVESREATNPAHRLSSHQYDELQQVVNATYSGEMSPEEEERLRPSAPQSDRRKRVARIRPDMTYEPQIPTEKYYKLKGLKWCSRITIGFVLVITLSALAFAGLAVTSYLLSSEDNIVHTFQDHTVLIDRPRPFWTRSLSVDTSGAYDNTYYYETSFYLLNCDELTTRPLAYTTNTTGTQPSSTNDVTVEITTGPNNTYAYLTAGSKVTFSVIVWSDYTYTKCLSEFNLYSDYDDFIGDEGVNAIYTNCIEIQESPHGMPTSFTYTVNRESFLFATLSVPREGSYAVNVSVQGQTYNTVNINATDEECTIRSTLDSAVDNCKFDLLSSPVTWALDELCIIAETEPSVPTSLSTASFIRFTVSYNPNIFRNFAYIVIVVPVPLYLVTCLLIWLCFKGCNFMYVQCRNMHYRHEYQVTEI